MDYGIDPEQLTGDIARLGVIASVNPATGTCTVAIGDLLTGDVPWLAPRAGGVRIWSVPTIGEQCLFICPEGDTEAGIALLGLYSDSFPAPSANPDLHLIQFDDGAQLVYNSASHSLTATLPAGGTATITADGGITINGDVTVNGKITASDDVIGSGISLKTHKHGGVQSGGSQTGTPS